MASQSDEISDEENGNNSDIDPIEVAIDAGATLSKPASASICRKRKIHVNEGKYKERESGTSTSSSGKGNTMILRIFNEMFKWQQTNKHVLSIYLKQNDSREQATFLNFGGNFLIFEQL